MAKLPVIGALLLLIGLAAWLLTSDRGAAPVLAPGDHPTDSAANARANAAATKATAIETAVEPTRTPSAAGAERTAVEPAGAATDGLLVHCVTDGETPVGGARLWYVREADASTRQRFRNLDEIDALIAEHGQEVVARADGTAHVSVAEHGNTLLMATSGELWGSMSVNAGHEDPVTLVMDIDHTLRVRVVGAAGEPVGGVPVAIEQRHRDWQFAQRHAETAAGDGIAVFRHAQRTVREIEDRSYAAVVEAALEPVPAHALEPAALPAEPVTLRLPPHGAVEVRVIDTDGDPFIGRATAELGVIRAGEAQRLSPFGGVRRRYQKEQVDGGRVRFAVVALGAELDLGIRRGSSRIANRTFAPGPMRPGETVVLEARLGSDHPVLQLRAIDQAGHPIGETALNVRVQSEGLHLTTNLDTAVRTATDGTFHVDIAADWIEGSTRLLQVAKGSVDDPELRGEVDLSRQIGTGPHDLGTVTLAAPPLFAGGRVVDIHGNPIAGARLLLRRRVEDQSWWNHVHEFDHRSDQRGEFAIREAIAGAEFTLGAAAATAVTPMQTFEPGADGLVLEVQEGGTIAGRLLVDDSIPTNVLYANLKAREGVSLDHLQYHEHRRQIGDDGEFAVSRLLPGSYDLRIEADGLDEPLETIENVVVPAGQAAQDARLTIDLRGALHHHHVTVSGIEGRVQGQLLYGPTGTKPSHTRHFWKPEIDLVTRFAAFDLVLMVTGRRTETRTAVSGRIEIEMRAGIRVRIALQGDAALPTPPLHVKAVLVPEGNQPGGIDFGADAFDERRSIVVRVVKPGPANVYWVLERRSPQHSMATSMKSEPLQTAEVADTDAVQEVRVTLTEAELERLLQQLR